MTEAPRFVIERPVRISLGKAVMPFHGSQEYLKPLPISEPKNELLWRAMDYNGIDGFVKATAVDVFHSGWERIKNAEMPLGPVNITAVAGNESAEIHETPLTLGVGFNIKNIVQLFDLRMLECEVVVGDKKYYLSWNDAEEMLEAQKRLKRGQDGHLCSELKTNRGNIVLLPLDIPKLSEQVSIEVVPAMDAFEKKFGKSIFIPDIIHSEILH